MTESTPELAAIKLLEHFWQERKLPIDPFQIAERAGVDVVREFSWQSGGVSGVFSLENQRPRIQVNPWEPEVRQRFTAAHELGHFMLQHARDGERVFRDTVRQFSMSNHDVREREANQFAAELLMPRVAVEQVISGGKREIRELAKQFGVSEVAMRYRLKNLGWIE